MKKLFIKKKGFTLIELLVVVAIIGILSSVILASLNTARAKSRNTKRKTDLTQVRTALELYYNDNGGYPKSYNNTWEGIVAGYNVCSGVANSCTYSGSSGYVPNLAPSYIGVLPKDPLDPTHGYLYNSNGTDYMLIAYFSVENCTYGIGTAGDAMTRPNYSTECDYAVYSPGAKTW